MKKFLKSKKFLASAAVAMSMIIAAGGAYAWFTRDVEVVANSGKFGRINIVADFAGFEDYLLEPTPDDYGPTVLEGTIDNKSDIDAILKVDLTAKVWITSDANGNPLDAGRWATNPESIAMMGIQVDESTLVGDMSEDYPWLTWRDKENPGVYYILLLPDSQAKDGDYTIDLQVLADPDKRLGNYFQGAEIVFNNNWFATQAFAEAIADEMDGIDVFDAGRFEILTAVNAFSPTTVGVQSFAAAVATIGSNSAPVVNQAAIDRAYNIINR